MTNHTPMRQQRAKCREAHLDAPPAQFITVSKDELRAIDGGARVPDPPAWVYICPPAGIVYLGMKVGEAIWD